MIAAGHIANYNSHGVNLKQGSNKAQTRGQCKYFLLYHYCGYEVIAILYLHVEMGVSFIIVYFIST